MQWSISMRPHTFNDMYGCEPIKKYFYNIVKKKVDFPSLTIFQGRFGGGKTTSAKILAQMILCTNPKENGDPCCECASCKSIIDETFDMDCMQIDGTQSGKSDLVEQITNFTSRPSIRGNHRKVLIIEEIQKLSEAAKQALLKVTEKPRKNIHFIITAMEPLEPGGLTSRSTLFNFDEAEHSDIMYCLQNALVKAKYWENRDIIGQSDPITFWGPLLNTLAVNAMGSFREAIQRLDECILAEAFTPSEAEKLLNVVSEESMYTALLGILNGKNDISTYNTLFYGQTLAKFNVAYKIINNAILTKTFNKSFDKSPYVKQLSEHKYFIKLINAFEKIYTSSPNPTKVIYREVYVSELCKLADACRLPVRGVANAS